MVSETPEPIRRLEETLLAFSFRHELAADAHLALTEQGRADEESAKLLRQSAGLAFNELPSLLSDSQALARRWSEQELLDPVNAAATLHALTASLGSIAAELEQLRTRHNAIVRTLRTLMHD